MDGVRPHRLPGKMQRILTTTWDKLRSEVATITGNEMGPLGRHPTRFGWGDAQWTFMIGGNHSTRFESTTTSD